MLLFKEKLERTDYVSTHLKASQQLDKKNGRKCAAQKQSLGINLLLMLFCRLSEYEKGGRDASEFLKWQETTRKVLEKQKL